MTEQKEDSKQKLSLIQTLFKQLTQLILEGTKTKLDATNMIIAVGQWTALMLATIITMVHKDQAKAFSDIDRVCIAINTDCKKHAVLLRGLKNKAKGITESNLILPKHLKEGSEIVL